MSPGGAAARLHVPSAVLPRAPTCCPSTPSCAGSRERSASRVPPVRPDCPTPLGPLLLRHGLALGPWPSAGAHREFFRPLIPLPHLRHLPGLGPPPKQPLYLHPRGGRAQTRSSSLSSSNPSQKPRFASTCTEPRARSRGSQLHGGDSTSNTRAGGEEGGRPSGGPGGPLLSSRGCAGRGPRTSRR